MNEEEIAELCRELEELATLVGARFIPDPGKIAAIVAANTTNP